MTIFGQQVQDTITVDPNTHLTPQNELFSSGSSMQLQKSVGYAEAVLKLMQEVQHLKVIYASILRVRGVYQILSTVINLAPTTSLLQTLLQSQGCAGHLSFMSVLLMLLTSSVGAKKQLQKQSRRL